MRQDGEMTFADPGADRPLLEMGTLQCVHCGGHFPARPPKNVGVVVGPEEAARMAAAGRVMRGFCGRCNGPICSPGCATCVPEEQMLDNIERGRPLDFVPASVSFSGLPSGLWG